MADSPEATPPAAAETAAEFVARKKAEIPREFKAKDIGRKGTNVWRLEAGTYRPQSNLPEKVFAFERLRLVRRSEQTAYEGGPQEGRTGGHRLLRRLAGHMRTDLVLDALRMALRTSSS